MSDIIVMFDKAVEANRGNAAGLAEVHSDYAWELVDEVRRQRKEIETLQRTVEELTCRLKATEEVAYDYKAAAITPEQRETAHELLLPKGPNWPSQVDDFLRELLGEQG